MLNIEYVKDQLYITINQAKLFSPFHCNYVDFQRRIGLYIL